MPKDSLPDHSAAAYEALVDAQAEQSRGWATASSVVARLPLTPGTDMNQATARRLRELVVAGRVESWLTGAGAPTLYRVALDQERQDG